MKTIYQIRLFNSWLLLFVSLTVSGFGADINTLRASQLLAIGRYAYNQKGDLELISTAAHFGFQFSGSSFKLYAYLPDPTLHNYIQYTVDGKYAGKLKLTGNRTDYSISVAGAGVHKVWIYKCTEASTGPIFIQKISAGQIVSLQIPRLPLIEFIGNSITCGAASDPSETPCGTGEYHDQHNGYEAYGPRLARALNLNYIVSGVSGIGIYRTWNMPGPNMPMLYDKTDFAENGKRLWNFKTYKPAIVSIALGTNDFSDGDHVHPRAPFDSAVFVSGYIRFVEQVKSKYPDAKIVLLSSPMLNGEKRERLQHCLTTVKTQTDAKFRGNNKMALFFFKPMNARGCGGHPNVEDHAILEKELEPFFRNLLANTK